MSEFEVVPTMQIYYDRMTTELAVQAATEMIEEWNYADDPHGYCHTRPMLVRLVQAVRGVRPTFPGETDDELPPLRRRDHSDG